MNFCTNCRWRFSGAYCPKCGNENETTEDETDGDVGEVTLGGEISHEEREAGARRKLWSAMHDGNLNIVKCKTCVRDLKALSPEDYYANFVDVFFTGSDRAISEFLDSSGGEKSSSGIGMYADAVLDCVCARMTAGLFYAVRDYKERSFAKDFSKYDKAIESCVPFTEKLRRAIGGRISSLKKRREDALFFGIIKENREQERKEREWLALEENRKKDEALRLELEGRRKKNEALRLESEERRKKEEALRLKAEEHKAKESAIRLAAEEQRKKDEALRLEAEERRKKEEALRLESEERIKKEKALRLEAEEQKKKDEALRLESEERKKKEEALRLEAEDRRKKEETLKLEAEAARKKKEEEDFLKFGWSKGLEFKLRTGEYFVTGIGSCKDLNLVIPAEYMGKPVTAIAKEAFKDCYDIKSVSIPSSVTSIGESAFSSCKSLTSVTIPSSVTLIAQNAFWCCTFLTSITIPYSVMIIGESAFFGCGRLIEVRNLSSLDIKAGDCGNGQVADYAKCVYSDAGPKGTFFTTKDGYEFYKFGDGYYLIGYKGPQINLVLPKTVEGRKYEVYSCAFSYCESLKTVAIPDTVASIGEDAFSNCASLTSITIPSTVTEIRHSMFSFCKALKSVIIPESVTLIDNFAFSSCSSLTSISIPSSVSKIGDYAFYNCSSLTSVTITFGVTVIGHTTFGLCSSLTSVIIPSSVELIEDSAFYHCNSLNRVFYSGSQSSWNKIRIGKNNEKLKGATIYYNCGEKQAKEIDSKENEKRSQDVGYDIQRMLADLPKAREILINDVMNNLQPGLEYRLESNHYVVTGIGRCKDAGITVPIQYNRKPVTAIAQGAFKRCISVKSVSIPSSVTSIENNAFEGCSSLESITIPNSVTSIGGYAFSLCISLKSITIPPSVKWITNGLFNFCMSLESVTIPSTVESIDGYAFNGCSLLHDVYYSGSKADWNKIRIGPKNNPLFGATIHYNSLGYRW